MIALYLPTLRHAWVFDDEAHLSGNPVVMRGLTADGVRWAFTTLSGTSWHPLTWLSYMGVIEGFGTSPAPQHAAGLLLHAASAALLFLALVRLTGAAGRSFLAAALFALHPLHVEPVAWAAMRKDVLCALFWMLALLAYARKAGLPGGVRTAAVAGAFALALMSKPMAVTLPAVLLALDWWPLGRLGGGGRPPAGAAGALAEKLPLLALSAAVVGVTAWGGLASEALVRLDALPLAARLKNIPFSYAAYLARAFWPAKLAVYYPLPAEGPPFAAWASATALLIAITALAIRERRRRPWLLAGWSWYLVALSPVVGIAPITFSAQADRYAYVPLVGIFVIAAWGGCDLLAGRRRWTAVPAAVAATVITLLAGMTRVQVGFWENPATLFGHALEVTEGNWLAHYGLAQDLKRRGDAAAAEGHYRAAIALNPGYKEARNNLGVMLAEQGDLDGSLAQFREALRYRPRAADLHYNAGVTLERLGRIGEAKAAFRKALELEPRNAEARAALEGLGGQAESLPH